MSDDQQSDAEVIARIRRGESEAFGELVQKYSGSLSGLAYDRLGNMTEAQDAVQDALVTAYTKLVSLREPAKFASWVYEILRKTCAMRFRSKGIDRRGVDVIAERRAGQVSLTPLESVVIDEHVARVRQAVADLPPLLREIVVLRYIGDTGRQEAAAILEISQDACDKRLERAIRTLRDTLRAK